MRDTSYSVPVAQPNPEFDRKFAFVAYGLLIIAIIFFTYLHYYQPQVLHVPSNVDISTWENPTFEQTCIYDRMTEAEKEKIRSKGIPGTDISSLLLYGILSIMGVILCFLHARRHYGLWMASCFLIGSFIFTGLQESLIILSGRFVWGGGAVDPYVFGTYWFPTSGLWFIETPVWVCLCWFLIAYSCVWTSGKVFPKMRLWPRALIGGLIAMGIDLWMDPVLTSPEIMKWVWAKGPSILIFGIPYSNFLGWFFLIFVFAILWEWLPRLEKRWGRAKASINFLLIVLIADIAVLAALLISGTIINALFRAQGLIIPPGW
ncbi:MAG: carotenoid biosynthesis protein [Deltaproteobacteria bacterium]|nr:carotenoid biosynthesis protein [Deltaproteobacteria bacterium]